MAELIIRTIDKEGQDNPKGHGRMMSGDVVAAMPDGHAWSQEERTHSRWRIVRVPLLPSEVTALVSNGNGDHSKQLVHKRKHGVDLSKLPLPDGTIMDIPLSVFRAAAKVK